MTIKKKIKKQYICLKYNIVQRILKENLEKQTLIEF